jgi:Family of unknown function (DUF5701)
LEVGVRRSELDGQVQTLLDRGAPAAAGVPVEEFLARLAPLRQQVAEAPAGADTAVLVVTDELVPVASLVAMLDLDGGQGFTTMPGEDIACFRPVNGLDVPAGPAYLLLGFDPGVATLDVPPQQALPQITGAGRSPLTVAEGLAVALHRPDVLQKHRFSLLGSRCGDRRVPALWVSDRRPRLGWCWDGAPHTWLGSASCAGRLGAG